MHLHRLRFMLTTLNLAAYLLMLVVNYLAVTLPLGGKTPGELSAQYPNLFVPANLTFSIWSVIYLSLAAFIVYSFVSARRLPVQEKSFIERIGLLFLLSSLANIAWIFAWQYEILPLSMLVMIVLLLTLIALYLRLQANLQTATLREKLLAYLPFSLYLGWISIALLANASALIVAYEVAVQPEAWAAVLMIAGTVLALTALWKRGDLFYALVVNWALLGILLNRLDDAVPSPLLIRIAGASMAAITLLLVIQLLRGRIYRTSS